MSEQVYAQLADTLAKIGFGVTKGTEFLTLIGELFTEEEARVAVNLSPLAPEPPERVAERMGEDPTRVARILDRMADKGVIYCSQKDEAKWYKIIQVVPGIFELQFMRGEITPRTKELAKLFEAYFLTLEKEGKKQEITPFARVIPVEKTVTAGVQVFPYETASHFIDQADTISVTTCYCRHEKRLLDHGCQYPDDVCLQFGAFARFIVQRKFGREVTREEAHEILRRSKEAGLIHTSNNTRDHIDFICNCCSCCCGILQSLQSTTMPTMAAASNYLARVDEARCVACAECMERCHMDAITMEGDRAKVDAGRCVGCGVCVNFCPSEAISLEARPERQEPLRNFRELVQRQIQDKVRLGEL
jgi:Na+-translocating ferredoxin:NAD+ oxidoreductase RNF subunit RnfB